MPQSAWIRKSQHVLDVKLVPVILFVGEGHVPQLKSNLALTSSPDAVSCTQPATVNLIKVFQEFPIDS